MVRSGLGFLFACKKDSNGDIGVLESFKVIYKGDEQHVTLTVAMDRTGALLIPAVSSLSLGLTSMRKMYQTPEDIDIFVKSNKSFFGKVGEFTLLASGTVVLNRHTGEVLSTKGLGLYVPKTVSEDPELTKGSDPVVLCEKLSLYSGINEFKVNEATYNAYVDGLLSKITPSSASGKGSFLKMLVFGEEA